MKLLVLLVLCAACRSVPRATGPYTPSEGVSRNTVQADAFTKRGAEIIHSDPERAETLPREALGEDLFFGPAHNNLGVLYLAQGKYYEAANEFEWARKLMPGHPDPRLNLAITLDRAGQDEEAFSAYSAALQAYPEYVPAIQGLARLVARSGKDEPRLEAWLRRLSVEGETEHWRSWARQQLLE